MVGQQTPEVLIALVPHMDAGDRDTWEGDQDQRPLSDLGRKQANALASAMASAGVTSLYASPARRAHATIEPLATKLGIEIQTLPNLAEKRPGESDTSLATRGERALDEIRRHALRGIAVAVSHGDLIPATINRLALRRRIHPQRLERRGQWYVVNFAADLSVNIELYEAPGFPQ